MRTLRFHEYGDALDVLRLDDAQIPDPSPGQVRVRVEACGLTPADWALYTGLFAGELPRGVGLEVAGTVSAVGAEVEQVGVGDAVFGPAPFNGPTAGASDEAVLDYWAQRPEGLSVIDAAALPMAVETAYRALDELGVFAAATDSVLVHGAGSTVGFAAVQMALEHGARVAATAGGTYATALEDLGALVTTYGDGMVDRILTLTGGTVAFALDAAPLGGGCLDELARVTGAADHVLTITDFEGAERVGARVSVGTESTQRNDVLAHYGHLAAAGRFRVPVARVFPLDQWREAAEPSMGHAGGKVVLRTADDHIDE